MKEYLQELGVLLKLFALVTLFFMYAIVVGTPARIRHSRM